MVIRAFLIFLLIAIPFTAQAVEPIRFVPVREKSEIRFEATQNDVPVQGGFDSFAADIAFHPEALATSKVKITVDMASVFADYDEIAETLKTAEWFDSGDFPQAVLETESFTALGEQRYEAKATLSIKDHKMPVTLHFTLNAFNDTQANVSGEAILKRTDFGIGWEDTDSVKDDVKVKFSVMARAAE